MANPLTPQGVTKDLQELGVTPPGALLELVEQNRLLSEAVNANPAADVAAAYRRGEITAKNIVKAAQAAAHAEGNRERLRSVKAALEQPWSEAIAAILRENGDDVVAALRPTFDVQVVALGEAVDLLGVNPDSRVVAAGGAGLGLASDRRKSAIQILRGVRILTNVLKDVGYYTSDGPARFLAGPAPAADLNRAAQAIALGGNDFEQLIGAGFRLQLNTGAETAAIVDAARSAEERRRQADAEERRAKGEAAAKRIADRYRKVQPEKSPA